MATNKRFIAVAGNIASGKSSLVSFLTAQYGFEAVYEPFVANPYLTDFYEDMKTWSFHSQVYFLAHKFRLHLGLNTRPGTVVQDRTIYEDAEIFCTNLHRTRKMKSRDYKTYMEFYESLRAVLRPPDLLIYLRCPVRSVKSRIRSRGRNNEQNIPTSYLKQLHSLYEDWIERYDMSPVLVWESADHDYLTDLVDQLEFREQLARFL